MVAVISWKLPVVLCCMNLVTKSAEFLKSVKEPSEGIKCSIVLRAWSGTAV